MCEICTLHNKETAQRCAACGSPNPQSCQANTEQLDNDFVIALALEEEEHTANRESALRRESFGNGELISCFLWSTFDTKVRKQNTVRVSSSPNQSNWVSQIPELTSDEEQEIEAEYDFLSVKGSHEIKRRLLSRPENEQVTVHDKALGNEHNSIRLMRFEGSGDLNEFAVPDGVHNSLREHFHEQIKTHRKSGRRRYSPIKVPELHANEADLEENGDVETEKDDDGQKETADCVIPNQAAETVKHPNQHQPLWNHQQSTHQNPTTTITNKLQHKQQTNNTNNNNNNIQYMIPNWHHHHNKNDKSHQKKLISFASTTIPCNNKSICCNSFLKVKSNETRSSNTRLMSAKSNLLLCWPTLMTDSVSVFLFVVAAFLFVCLNVSQSPSCECLLIDQHLNKNDNIQIDALVLCERRTRTTRQTVNVCFVCCKRTMLFCFFLKLF